MTKQAESPHCGVKLSRNCRRIPGLYEEAGRPEEHLPSGLPLFRHDRLDP